MKYLNQIDFSIYIYIYIEHNEKFSNVIQVQQLIVIFYIRWWKNFFNAVYVRVFFNFIDEF